MPKISFNAQALGFTSHSHNGDMGCARTSGPCETSVRSYPSIQSLFKGLGFTNVDRFPCSEGDLPTEDVDP